MALLKGIFVPERHSQGCRPQISLSSHHEVAFKQTGDACYKQADEGKQRAHKPVAVESVDFAKCKAVHIARDNKNGGEYGNKIEIAI